MRLGFHVSIAGGFKNVVGRALERQCETIQLFSRNPRTWKYRPLDRADIAVFRRDLAAHDIWPIFVHLPYLINLASPERGLLQKSLTTLIEDLKRSATIGASFLIMHVGSASDKDTGLRRISDGINQALGKVKNKVKLLLENTAGSGNELGYDFAQLRTLLDQVKDSTRIGVALDTAHAFAAGYDLRIPTAITRTLDDFEQMIGFRNLYLVHLNDSKTECGSHKDRHWHIGKGEIGHGMHNLLHHAVLQNLPCIMETPRTNLKEDIMNMKKAKQLLARPAHWSRDCCNQNH